jgi:aryl-alcohol dehydrogenase-like predicted oxidoreductase
VQATWNVLEPSVGPALEQARARGWGVLVKEALANGRLAFSGGDRAGTVLGQVGARRGAPVDQVALAAVLAQPWADVVLSGAVTISQLESNLAAVPLSLAHEDLALLRSVAEDPRRYWEQRAALPWS